MAIDFKNLATLVLKDVVDSGLAEKFRPKLADLERGLKRLSDDKILLPEDVQGKKGKTLLIAVRKAVELAQKTAGGSLTVDSLFGMQTLSWLEFGTRCLGRALKEWENDPVYRQENSIPSNVKFGKLEIRYFIEKLPLVQTSDPRKLLEQAWQSWMDVCGLTATETDDFDRCNVVITTQQIDGISNILADAHIGPPERVRLQLRFDQDEVFDEFRFEATACHEIGHLLGLGHSTQPGNLMNSSLGQLKKPGPEDAMLAAQEWGARPTPAEILPTPVVPRVVR